MGLGAELLAIPHPHSNGGCFLLSSVLKYPSLKVSALLGTEGNNSLEGEKSHRSCCGWDMLFLRVRC